jgi:ATP-dependent Clp protease ATP-binding subunit ClpX
VRYEPPTYESIPTVAEMVASMDAAVSGLETVKPRLALILRRFMVAASQGHPRPAMNVVICAPTGAGKTHVLRCLLNAIPVMHTEVNATEYSDVGYRGRDLTSMYLGLLGPRWRGDPKPKGAEGETPYQEREITTLAERWGVVVIDEFDKLRASRTPGSTDREVGRVLQAELLKLVEGTQALCRRSDDDRGVLINTNNILHIAAGAFQGLNEVVLKDLLANNIGVANRDHAYEKATPADIIEYGFLEELMGRFSSIVTLPPLNGGHLSRIFREHVIPGVQIQCADDGIELVVDEGAISAAGSYPLEGVHGARHSLGARALSTLLEECLEKQWAQAQPGDRLVLDADGVIHRTCRLERAVTVAA